MERKKIWKRQTTRRNKAIFHTTNVLEMNLFWKWEKNWMNESLLFGSFSRSNKHNPSITLNLRSVRKFVQIWKCCTNKSNSSLNSIEYATVTMYMPFHKTLEQKKNCAQWNPTEVVQKPFHHKEKEITFFSIRFEIVNIIHCLRL